MKNIFQMIGEKLRTAFKNAGIPLAKVAEHIGISQTALYGILKKESFEISYLLKASELLGVPASHFLDESETTPQIHATQTGMGNQAGTGNTQKIKVGKGANSVQEVAAELAACRRELALTQALVASHQETISLLRGSYNRPN